MSTTTVLGVAVFDGHARLDGRFDVTFDAHAIRAVVPTGSTPTGSDAVVDGTGSTLLPGLIDTHVHMRSADQLTALAHFGVTTAIDLGQWSPEVVTALHAAEAGADFRTSGGALAGPGGPHAKIPGFPPQNLVRTGEEARAAVERRVGEGSDYVKLILEAPGGGGLEVATATAAVEAAHGHGHTVVAHATSTGAFAIAVQAGVDVLTHAPLDAPLPAALVEQILALGAVTVPTLVMMRGTATNLAIPRAALRQRRAVRALAARSGGADRRRHGRQ